MKTHLLLTGVFFLSIILLSCRGENGQNQESDLLDQTGIQIEGAWARPAAEGQISAAYFLVSNFDEQPDTLVSVRSEAAQNVEVHESYEQEDNMMGMRQVTNLEIPSQSTIRFEQGGLHIMLMQLTDPLEDGDSFELTLIFANNGEVVVDVPVRI